jgi:hypothetical protein
MKKFLSAVPIVLILLFQNFSGKQKFILHSEELWTGTITFSQITYDTVRGTHYCGWDNDTSWSEWRMEANIINNKGSAKSNLFGWKRGSGYDTCMGAWGAIRDTTYAIGNATTELDLGIDGKEYGFTVDIPACTGTKISKRYRNFKLEDTIVDDVSEGDSQIHVDRQKVGTNPNILSGTIELRDKSRPGYQFVQIWKWNLKKIK